MTGLLFVIDQLGDEVRVLREALAEATRENDSLRAALDAAKPEAPTAP